MPCWLLLAPAAHPASQSSCSRFCIAGCRSLLLRPSCCIPAFPRPAFPACSSNAPSPRAAARMAFKLPALAASSITELQAQMDTLSQLLALDTPAVRTLVLRQPSLLSRTQDSLQAKIEAYADLFAPDTGLVRARVCRRLACLPASESAVAPLSVVTQSTWPVALSLSLPLSLACAVSAVGAGSCAHVHKQALAAAPQLLTMKVDAVKSRFELLSQLAELQPAWRAQLEEATVETLAVWLCSRCVAVLCSCVRVRMRV